MQSPQFVGPMQEPQGQDLIKRLLASRYNPEEDFKGYAADTLASIKAINDAKAALEQGGIDSQTAGLEARKKAYDLPVPQQEEQQSQGQFPRFQGPEIPGRPRPQQDRTAQILSGLAAALAPGHMAGGLLASPIEGALQNAEQSYQDKLGKYKMQFQQAAIQHEDDLQARNEESKRLAANASVRYNNKLGQFKNAFDSVLNVDAPLAELKQKGISYKGIGSLALKADEAEAQAKLDREKIGILTAADKSEQAAELKALQIENQNLRTSQIIQGQNARNDANLTVKKSEGEANRDTKESIAADTNISREKMSGDRIAVQKERNRIYQQRVSDQKNSLKLTHPGGIPIGVVTQFVAAQRQAANNVEKAKRDAANRFNNPKNTALRQKFIAVDPNNPLRAYYEADAQVRSAQDALDSAQAQAEAAFNMKINPNAEITLPKANSKKASKVSQPIQLKSLSNQDLFKALLK